MTAYELWELRAFDCRHFVEGTEGNGWRGCCAIPHYNRGGMTLDEVGKVLGVTRERVRQIEEKALIKLALNRDWRIFADLLGISEKRAASLVDEIRRGWEEKQAAAVRKSPMCR